MLVSTIDCRKQPLVFKISIYELRHDLLLVEFRRSKVSFRANVSIIYTAFISRPWWKWEGKGWGWILWSGMCACADCRRNFIIIEVVVNITIL